MTLISVQAMNILVKSFLCFFLLASFRFELRTVRGLLPRLPVEAGVRPADERVQAVQLQRPHGSVSLRRGRVRGHRSDLGRRLRRLPAQHHRQELRTVQALLLPGTLGYSFMDINRSILVMGRFKFSFKTSTRRLQLLESVIHRFPKFRRFFPVDTE